MVTPKNKLIIFVKAPRPGFVKSRLAASLGANGAAAAYRALVETLLANLTHPCSPQPSQPDSSVLHAAFGTPHSTELRYTPDDAFTEIAPWLRPEWTASPQETGDLGQ